MTTKTKIISAIAGVGITAGAIFTAQFGNEFSPENQKVYTAAKTSFVNYTGADTFVLNDALGYYFGQLNGIDSTHKITFVIDHNITIQNGFDIENCNNFQIISLNGARAKITGTGGNWAIHIHGTASWMDISGIDVYNSMYAVVMKNEGGCDPRFNYPNGHFHIKLHDITATDIHQDGFYLETTDPYNTGRPVSCNGKTTYPRGSRAGWVEVFNCRLHHVQRSGIQLSNCDTGTNSIHDNDIYDCGDEFNNSQGGGIIAGSATTNISIYNNHINKTWDHGIWGLPTGLCKIYNNTIDSSGFAGTRKQVYDISPIFLNSYANPLTAPPLRFMVYNNTTGASTDKNGYSVALFNGNNHYADTGNYLFNSGKVYAQAGIKYSTKEIVVDTIIAVPVDTVKKDTSIFYFTLNNKDSSVTFHRADGSELVFMNVDRAVGSITKNYWKVYFKNGTNKILK